MNKTMTKLTGVLIGIALICLPVFGQNTREGMAGKAMSAPEQDIKLRSTTDYGYTNYSMAGEPRYKCEGEKYYKWTDSKWVETEWYEGPENNFLTTGDFEPYPEIVNGEFRFYKPGINAYFWTYWTWGDSAPYTTVTDSKGRLTECIISDYRKFVVTYDHLDRLFSVENYSNGELRDQCRYEYHLDTNLRTLFEWVSGDGTPYYAKEIRTYQRMDLPDGGYINLVLSSEFYYVENGAWSGKDTMPKREAVYDSNGNRTIVNHYIWEGSDWILDSYTVFNNNDVEFLSANNTLYKYNGEGGDVVIPNDLGITSIGASAFEGNTAVTSVVIPGGVTEIGQAAFKDCENMASVTMPGTVQTIREEAFYNNSRLTSVAVPNATTAIETAAFGACESLTAINVDAANTAYSSTQGVLYNKNQSLLHTYPAGKTEAFALPATVTSIGNAAFQETKAAAVTLNSTVQTIGTQAFSSSKNLTAMEIPSSVTTIGQLAFDNCARLEAINVSANNARYSSTEGVLYNKNQTILLTYPEGKTAASYTVPATVTTIEQAAFSQSRLASVTISNSVTTIGDAAFRNNSNLKTVDIPSSVHTIQTRIFAGCTALTNVTVRWSSPPLITEDVFGGVNRSRVMLHVPAGRENAYRIASVWKDFRITSSPVSVEGVEGSSLKALLTNGLLHIAGLQPGEAFSLYTVGGQLVYQGTAKSTSEYIPFPGRGIYILTNGRETVKVMEN